MKIVCLVRRRPHHRYLVNQVHRHHGVALAVVETPKRGHRLKKTLQQKGVWETGRLVLNQVASGKGEAAALDEVFGPRWRQIDEGVRVLTVEDVNAPVVLEALRRIGPDLLLDHGTSIVKDPLLATAGLTLNVHWGLSPYYRGTSCTEWALLNWDPYNVGVTVHELSRRIDGGDIVAQRRVALYPGDSVEAINHRLTYHGTELVVQAVEQLANGEVVRGVKQSPEAGFLYLKKHFGRHLLRQIRHIEKKGLIAEMLKKPARPAQPITEGVPAGVA